MNTSLENTVYNSLRPNTVNKEIGKERHDCEHGRYLGISEKLAVRKNQHPLCPGTPGSAHEVQGVV